MFQFLIRKVEALVSITRVSTVISAEDTEEYQLGDSPNGSISINQVTLSFDNELILTDVNLDIYPEDFIVLTGPVGSGKSMVIAYEY